MLKTLDPEFCGGVATGVLVVVILHFLPMDYAASFCILVCVLVGVFEFWRLVDKSTR